MTRINSRRQYDIHPELTGAAFRGRVGPIRQKPVPVCRIIVMATGNCELAHISKSDTLFRRTHIVERDALLLRMGEQLRVSPNVG